MEGVELLKKNKNGRLFLEKMPPIFSTFIKNYAIGKDGFKINYLKFNEDLIQLTSITFFSDNGYENSVSHFFSPEELENELKSYAAQFDDYHKQGFIRIGLFDISDSILLGVTKENSDTIWKLNGDWGDDRPYKEKLADDIFEFINSLKEVIIKVNLLARKIDEKKLYKNWDEDFWRVKTSNFA